MRRSCEWKHPDPKVTEDKCPLCYRAVHSARHQVVWGLPVTAPGSVRGRRRPSTGAEVRVQYCRSRDMWDWVVIAEGAVKVRGTEKSGKEAWREANEAKKVYRPACQWISTSQLAQDTVLLASKLPRGITGVAGIPRSGMIPASILSAILHVPLYELTEEGVLNRLGYGSRGRASVDMYGKFEDTEGTLLIVDDTVYGGEAMSRTRIAMAKHKVKYAAVYVRPQVKWVVDYYAMDLPSPHLLEWNWTNNGPYAGFASNPIYGEGIACDLDGIICHDDQSGGVCGSPYFIPRLHPCPMIVTGRSESQRKNTEEWLKLHEVKYDRLVMFPTDWDRHSLTIWKEIAGYKAKVFEQSDCGFFAESCPRQAEMIAELSGKPVICPIVGKVF